MRIVIHDKYLEPLTVLALPVDQYRKLNNTGLLRAIIDGDQKRSFIIRTIEVKAPDKERACIYYTEHEEQCLGTMPAILPGQQALFNQLTKV